MDTHVETPAGPVSIALDGRGASDVLVLAPGAGAGMQHPFMEAVATRLAAGAVTVVRFNFAYSEAGKKAPDRQPVLEETFRTVAEKAAGELAPERFFLGGKSMGGRIASHLAAGGFECDGLVFLGYPLHPPGRPDRIRDAHLYEIETPMLFVEGTRDPFCPLDTLEAVRAKLGARSDLVVIPDGDHSFRVPKSSGRSHDDALDEVTAAVGRWIRDPR